METVEGPLRVAITGATGKVGRLLAAALAEGLSADNRRDPQNFRRNVELRLLYHSREFEAAEADAHLPEEEQIRRAEERKKRRRPGVVGDELSWEEEMAIGLSMELEDCYFPQLAGITVTGIPSEAFDNAEVVVMVASISRLPGQSHDGFMLINRDICIKHARAIERYAHKDVKVLVVTNPCVTLARVARHAAPSIPPHHITALSRLDVNRASLAAARHLGIPPSSLSDVITWGDHDVTQLFDFDHCRVGGEPISAESLAKLQEPEFMKKVRNRSSDVARYSKETADISTVHAIKRHLQDWLYGTEDKITSMAVCSDGSYGVPQGLFFSLPVRCSGGEYRIVNDLSISTATKKKINKNGKFLQSAWLSCLDYTPAPERTLGGYHYYKRFKKLATIIKSCDALVICAGAGMSMDSGIQDYYNGAFAKAHPILHKMGMTVFDASNHNLFVKDPELAWGLFGTRMNQYRQAQAHPGYAILLRWANERKLGYTIYTSNVDKMFIRSGFDIDRLHECHGTIYEFQCTNTCTTDVWDGSHVELEVDDETLRAKRTELPQCKNGCGAHARPATKLAIDEHWMTSHLVASEKAHNQFVENLPAKSTIVVLEIGCGTQMKKVRIRSEVIVNDHRAKGGQVHFIRVNPHEPQLPDEQHDMNYVLRFKALDVLSGLDTLLQQLS